VLVADGIYYETVTFRTSGSEGKWIQVKAEGGGAIQFGRLLAYAYAGDTLVNLALVEGGFALAMHEGHARRDEFLAAGEAAYAARRGLWSPEACGAPPAAGVTLLEVEANPPGPRRERPQR
jgi:endonuclease YncB( thermonuclease family)